MSADFTILDATPRYLVRVYVEVEVCPEGPSTPIDRLVEAVRLAVEQGTDRNLHGGPHASGRAASYSRVYAPDEDRPGTWATERGVVWSPPQVTAELIGLDRNPDTCLTCATEGDCEAHR